MICLIASGEALGGGVGTYIRDQLDAFPDAVLLTGQDFSHERSIKIDGLNRIPSLKSLITICKKMREGNAKICICHSTAGLLTSILLKIFFKDIFIINVYHGLASNYKKYLYLLEYVSDKVSDLSVFMNYKDPKKIRSKNWKFVGNYSSRSVIKSNSNFEGKIVTVTRHSDQKNNEELFEVIRNLPEREFCIFTKEHDHSYFRTALKDLGIRNVNVCYAKNIEDIYADKSLFILCSNSEGFPLSVLEAASFGVPAIISERLALSQIFGKNIKYAKNITDYQTSILSLLGDVSAYKHACNSALYLAKEYSYERWISEWSNIINETASYHKL